jgi:hypothetical protein
MEGNSVVSAKGRRIGSGSIIVNSGKKAYVYDEFLIALWEYAFLMIPTPHHPRISNSIEDCHLQDVFNWDIQEKKGSVRTGGR